MTGIAFIGAGRVASTLARAFVANGVPVAAIASRNDASARRLAQRVRGADAVSMQDAAAADLVFLTVPDDDIATVCDTLAWRDGQAVVHCSGATEVAVLDAAARRGALIGGFHPLQTFADPDRAVELLAGTTVAIEGPASLAATLRELAERLGMKPLSVPPGARAAYHGGASFAAGFIASMFEEAAAMWASFGIDERATLDALLPLARGALASVESRGIAGAVSGPVSRGDAGVVARHLAAFDAQGPDHGRFYREFARRALKLAIADRRIDAAQVARMRAVLDAEPIPEPGVRPS